MWFRNHQSGADDGEGGADKRRREGRGLGPFSGGQLTIIIVTLALVVAFPVAASAVTGSNSFITDFTSGVHAKVDAKQNVSTAIHDPVSGVGATVDAKNNLNTAIHDAGTGTAAKVNALGQLSTAVTGSVTVNGTARVANPTASYTTFVDLFGITCATVAPPSGNALVVTSVTENFGSISTSPAGMQLVRDVGSCGGGFSSPVVKSITSFTSLDTQTISFPSGLIIPDGAVLRFFTNGGHGEATVNGYLLPDSYCPTFSACELGD